MYIVISRLSKVNVKLKKHPGIFADLRAPATYMQRQNIAIMYTFHVFGNKLELNMLKTKTQHVKQ